jgi:SAM-dependent methyltransferase
VIFYRKIPTAGQTLLFCLFLATASSSDFSADRSKHLNKSAIRSELLSQGNDPAGKSVVQAQVKRRSSRGGKKPALRRPDVIYYPTPDETVTEMLNMANIKPGDVLYDLGSGDGRIPIRAAQLYGIHSVGIEIDAAMVEVAQERAEKANLSSLVRFVNADMFRTDISSASVVTLYLSNKINLLLRPKLLHELKPGTRILSHDFDMGDWKPDRKVRVPWEHNLYRTIYLWTIPQRRGNRKPTEKPAE